MMQGLGVAVFFCGIGRRKTAPGGRVAPPL
uniref:Uncharacterized protein n=1 Tax=Ackermannviridae sp. TaxID=2831612 RepID=A0A8S5RQP3_9CAUD|nr:MAG TPA: hypothetical protein [Ackermannviridae sp.]